MLAELIKVGFVGYVCSKALKSFGKNEYGEMIGLITWIYLGFLICTNMTQWYNGFMDSRLIRLAQHIFGKV